LKRNTDCYDTRIKVHRTSGSILIAESASNDRQAVGFPSPFEVSQAAPKCQKHHVSLGAEAYTRNVTTHVARAIHSRERAEAGKGGGGQRE